MRCPLGLGNSEYRHYFPGRYEGSWQIFFMWTTPTFGSKGCMWPLLRVGLHLIFGQHLNTKFATTAGRWISENCLPSPVVIDRRLQEQYCSDPGLPRMTHCGR